MSDRRAVIGGLGGALAASIFSAQAQRRMPVVVFFGLASRANDEPVVTGLRRGLSDLGYNDGRDITIETRWTDGRTEQIPAIIAELASRNVDVVVAPGPAIARALARGARLPVVGLNLPPTPSDPDLFASLAKPGGTVTGFSGFGEELSAKRIELLNECLPNLKAVGVLHNALDPTFHGWGVRTEAALRERGLKPVRMGLSSTSVIDLRATVIEMQREGAAAMIVIRDFLTTKLGPEICDIALGEKIAVFSEARDLVALGAFISYGADPVDQSYRAAVYVDKILKGAKPGDLPIQLATKLELIINLKTAKALGLTVAQSVLARADEVIE